MSDIEKATESLRAQARASRRRAEAERQAQGTAPPGAAPQITPQQPATPSPASQAAAPPSRTATGPVSAAILQPAQDGAVAAQPVYPAAPAQPAQSVEPAPVQAPEPAGKPRRYASTLEIPLKWLTKQGFVTPETPKGRLTEEFRRIKRTLLKNLDNGSIDGAPANVVMVTSSMAGEGKTYTSINLAMSLAQERERTVLLVDADVFRGTAGRTLDILPSEPGLIDFLNGDETSASDIIMQTNIPNLRIIAAGRSSDHANELLSSDSMRQFVDELAQRYSDRIIIMDCPPILQTNEANVLTSYAGQIVFVVAAEETSQRYVVEALRHIGEEKYVGVLLNKSSKRHIGYGYDYGYD